MADKKRGVEGNPDYERKDPFTVKRSTFQSDLERVQSGGLDDDPTESGEPVRDKTPYKNLKGGR